MNTDAKMLNKILVYENRHISRSSTVIKLVLLSPKCRDSPTYLINIINYINGLQDQNYMIISIDEEKLMKSNSFMIKDLGRVGLEGMYLKVIKAI